MRDATHLGTAAIGGLYGYVPPGRAVETLATAHALSQTGLSIDTSHFYQRALFALRTWFQACGGVPDNVDLTVKVGRLFADHFDTGPTKPFTFDLTHSGVTRSLSSYKELLGLPQDYPGLTVYLHDVDSFMSAPDHKGSITEGWQSLAAMKTSGRVARIGIGMNNADMLAQLIVNLDPTPDVVMCAGRYNLVDKSASEALFSACQTKGVELLNAGVFASGFLVGTRALGTELCGYRPATDEDRIWRFQLLDICSRHSREVGLTPAEILRAAALQFAAAPDAVSSIVHSAANAAEVRDSLEFAAFPLPQALIADLVALRLPEHGWDVSNTGEPGFVL